MSAETSLLSAVGNPPANGTSVKALYIVGGQQRPAGLGAREKQHNLANYASLPFALYYLYLLSTPGAVTVVR